MMSIVDFLNVVVQLCIKYDMSVVSWIRTRKRNTQVGGHTFSYHMVGLAVDVVMDDPTQKEFMMNDARRLGVIAVDEGDHIHLQVKGVSNVS